MPELNKSRAFTVAEVAAKAHISKKLVYSEISRGRLPATRLGRLVRVTPEAFAQWMSGKSDPLPINEQIAEVLRGVPPLTDDEVDAVVAIIRADSQ